MSQKSDQAGPSKDLKDLLDVSPEPGPVLGETASDAELLEKLDGLLNSRQPGPDQEPAKPALHPANLIRHGPRKPDHDQERAEMKRLRNQTRGRPGNMPPTGGSRNRGRG